MRGDYIEIDGPGSEQQVLDVIFRLFGAKVHLSPGPLPGLTLEDSRTIMFVEFDPSRVPCVTIAIGNMDDDDAATHWVSDEMYRELVANTFWRLRRSFDPASGRAPGGLYALN